MGHCLESVPSNKQTNKYRTCFKKFKHTLWALKQYNLLYGDVLTNAQIEEGVEREIERVNVRYGLTHASR